MVPCRSRNTLRWTVRSPGESAGAPGSALRHGRGAEHGRGCGAEHGRGCGMEGGREAGRSALLAEARGALIVAGCALVLVAALCGGLLLCLAPAPAQAVPTELQSVELQGEVKDQVDDLTAQAADLQAEIDALDTELEGYSESYNQMQLRLTDINNSLTTLRRQLNAAQSEHAYRMSKYEQRICALYKNGGGDEFLTLLLASDGLVDLVQRVRLVATLADRDQHLVDNLSESTAKLNALLAEIDEKKTEELAVRKQIEDQKDRIQTMLAEREATLGNVDSEITAVIQQEQQRQAYTGSLPQTDDEIINQFLQTAAYYIGVPYVWGGDRPSTGFDCSGYVAFVYAQHGVDLPHYSGYQAEMGTVVMPEDIQPGDLLAFGWPVHHVGIYLGDGLFIHAPRTGDVVSIWELNWKTNLSYIRRFDLKPRTGPPAVW